MCQRQVRSVFAQQNVAHAFWATRADLETSKTFRLLPPPKRVGKGRSFIILITAQNVKRLFLFHPCKTKVTAGQNSVGGHFFVCLFFLTSFYDSFFTGRQRRPELVEKGSGMFETSLRHVSGLTRPRLYAVGQADSGLLFPQLCFKNKMKSLNFETK